MPLPLTEVSCVRCPASSTQTQPGLYRPWPLQSLSCPCGPSREGLSTPPPSWIPLAGSPGPAHLPCRKSLTRRGRTLEAPHCLLRSQRREGLLAQPSRLGSLVGALSGHAGLWMAGLRPAVWKPEPGQLPQPAPVGSSVHPEQEWTHQSTGASGPGQSCLATLLLAAVPASGGDGEPRGGVSLFRVSWPHPPVTAPAPGSSLVGPEAAQKAQAGLGEGPRPPDAPNPPGSASPHHLHGEVLAGTLLPHGGRGSVPRKATAGSAEAGGEVPVPGPRLLSAVGSRALTVAQEASQPPDEVGAEVTEGGLGERHFPEAVAQRGGARGPGARPLRPRPRPGPRPRAASAAQIGTGSRAAQARRAAAEPGAGPGLGCRRRRHPRPGRPKPRRRPRARSPQKTTEAVVLATPRGPSQASDCARRHCARAHSRGGAGPAGGAGLGGAARGVWSGAWAGLEGCGLWERSLWL